MINSNIITEAFLFTTVWIFILMSYYTVKFWFKRDRQSITFINYYLAYLFAFMLGFFISNEISRDHLTNTIAQYIMLVHLNFTPYFISLNKYLTQ